MCFDGIILWCFFLFFIVFDRIAAYSTITHTHTAAWIAITYVAATQNDAQTSFFVANYEANMEIIPFRMFYKKRKTSPSPHTKKIINIIIRYIAYDFFLHLFLFLSREFLRSDGTRTFIGIATINYTHWLVMLFNFVRSIIQIDHRGTKSRVLSSQRCLNVFCYCEQSN